MEFFYQQEMLLAIQKEAVVCDLTGDCEGYNFAQERVLRKGFQICVHMRALPTIHGK